MHLEKGLPCTQKLQGLFITLRVHFLLLLLRPHDDVQIASQCLTLLHELRGIGFDGHNQSLVFGVCDLCFEFESGSDFHSFFEIDVGNSLNLYFFSCEFAPENPADFVHFSHEMPSEYFAMHVA